MDDAIWRGEADERDPEFQEFMRDFVVVKGGGLSRRLHRSRLITKRALPEDHSRKPDFFRHGRPDSGPDPHAVGEPTTFYAGTRVLVRGGRAGMCVGSVCPT